jgi:hypothetical protein
MPCTWATSVEVKTKHGAVCGLCSRDSGWFRPLMPAKNTTNRGLAHEPRRVTGPPTAQLRALYMGYISGGEKEARRSVWALFKGQRVLSSFQQARNTTDRGPSHQPRRVTGPPTTQLHALYAGYIGGGEKEARRSVWALFEGQRVVSTVSAGWNHHEPRSNTRTNSRYWTSNGTAPCPKRGLHRWR